MKRVIAALALCLAFALPAQAEVSGVYMGLKVIDSMQNTGNVSQDKLDGFGVGQFGQNTFGGGIFIGYDFYPKMQLPIRAELEYAIRSNMQETWESEHAAGNINGRAVDGRVETDAQWNAQTVFANFYYDFHNDSAFTPYVGAGLGLAFVNTKYTMNAVGSIDGNRGEVEIGSASEMNTNFAWNVGLGCSYAFTENISLDAAYRFVSLGHTEVSKNIGGQEISVETSPYANEFSLGLRVTF